MYQIEPYRSPLTSTITQLIGAGDRAHAQAALVGGQAAAQAAQSIGDTVSSGLQRFAQYKMDEPKRDLVTAQLTNEKAIAAANAQKVLDRTTVDGIMANAMKVDDTTGVATLDRNKFQQALIQGGNGHLYPEYAAHLDSLDASTTKLAAERRNLVARGIYSVQQSGNTPDAVATIGAYLKANGAITDEHLQPILDAAKADPSPEHISSLMTQLATSTVPSEYRDVVNAEEKRKADLAKSTAEAGKATAETRKAAAEAAKLEAENAPGWRDDFKTKVSELIPETDKANAALRARTLARLDIARTRTEGDKAIQDLSGELRALEVATNPDVRKARIEFVVGSQEAKDAAYTKMYAPSYDNDGNEVPNAQAKAIAEYRSAPVAARSLTTGGGRALMDEVARLNPAYDASQWQVRGSTRKAFTTGTQGQQINAINTAIGHMDQLATAADALGNGSFRPGNAVWNALKKTFGSSAPTNFDTLKEFLDGEIGSVVKKGAATEGEMKRLQENIRNASSPEQLQGYIKTVIPILGSKLSAFDHQYHGAMGPTDPFTPLSPEAKGILVKYGFDPTHPTIAPGGAAAAGVTVTSPSGKSYTLKDQASADAFIADAKAKGLWK